MQEAAVANLSQNRNLKEKLLAIVGLCHVECNPYDTFWSSGLKLGETGKTPSNWIGQNKLGACLDDTGRAFSS